MGSGRVAFAAAVIGAVSLVCAWSSSAAPQAGSRGTEAAAASTPETTATDIVAGKAVFERVCSECHEAEFATQMRNTGEGWTLIVDRMVSHGMDASADQKALIIDYLAKNYRPNP